MKKVYYKNYTPDIYIHDKNRNLRFVLGNKGKKPIICVGINPSNACLELSDPTMNDLVVFSKKHGYDSCIMVNPYPLICPHPSKLPKKYDVDICHENLKEIENIFKEFPCGSVLAMWGNYINTNASFKEMVGEILNLAIKYNMKLWHVHSLSKSGNPYHFRYLKRQGILSGDYSINALDIKAYIENKCV